MPDHLHDADVERQLDVWVASRSIHLSPEAARDIRAALPSSLDPVRALPSQGRLAATFLAVFAALILTLMAVMDKAGFRLMTGIQMAGMATVLTVGGILFSLALARRMVPGSQPGAPVPLLLVFVGLAAAGVVALLFPWKIAGPFVAEGWPCAAMELVVVLPVSVVFYLIARRGALFADAGLGAVLSGLAAALALLVAQFQCMSQQSPHLLVWHGTTAAIVIGSGALAGQWLRNRWLP